MSQAILAHTLARKSLSRVIPAIASPIRSMGGAR